ncbi:MAG: TerB family tellurite resistance protein [Deltaproteobacteria bacterium]|nr:TerB family tellurite resistance protein [Deltaproteobacteria bacterium]
MEYGPEKATLAISLMAAMSDGDKASPEREQLKKVAESFSDPNLNLMQVYQEVLLGKVALPQLVQTLDGRERRLLAYEMAVAVCDADGVSNEAEKKFLEDLRRALGLEEAAAAPIFHQAEELAAAPLAAAAGTSGSAARPAVDEAALDKSILNYAVLNGALELLPNSLATMAIIPLQTKMVYEIGQSYGFSLDRGHIKDFMATIGIGMTSQVLENYAKKFLGKFLNKSLGGLLGGLGRQATSSGFSFASTYALGQLAKSYYAQGRRLDSGQLKGAFQDLLSGAQGLQEKYLGQIQQKAQGLDVSQILSMVRR